MELEEISGRALEFYREKIDQEIKDRNEYGVPWEEAVASFLDKLQRKFYAQPRGHTH